MKIKILVYFGVLLLVLTDASAEEKRTSDGKKAKALSGMSIVGNDEAPKALYIVPWKSSVVGVETVLDLPANRGYVVIDQDEFRRKLDYYTISKKSNTGR